MRQSDRADMGPDANDPRGVCRVTVGLAARLGCSAGRLLANLGWGLRGIKPSAAAILPEHKGLSG